MKKKDLVGVKMEEIEKLLSERVDADEVLLREVKPFGLTGAHISAINPDHIGKKARIIIKPREEEKE